MIRRQVRVRHVPHALSEDQWSRFNTRSNGPHTAMSLAQIKNETKSHMEKNKNKNVCI